MEIDKIVRDKGFKLRVESTLNELLKKMEYKITPSDMEQTKKLVSIHKSLYNDWKTEEYTNRLLNYQADFYNPLGRLLD